MAALSAITVTGVIDSESVVSDTVRKSGGIVSSTKTTTHYEGTDQSVVSEDRDSVIIGAADALLQNPTQAFKDAVAEVQSFSDQVPESGAIERLLTGLDRVVRGNTAVNLDQINQAVGDSRFVDKSAEEIASIRIEDRAAVIERTLGAEAADAFREAATTDEQLRNYFLTDAKAIAAIRDSGLTITDPQQLIGLPIGRPEAGDGGEQQLGEINVSGTRTLGDATAKALVVAQDYLTELETNNPILFEAAQLGLSIGKGPLGGLGSYALDKAVAHVMEQTGLDRQAAYLMVSLGTMGLSILSENDLDDERSIAASDGGHEAGTLVMAGVTILGISSIAKAVKDLRKPTVTIETNTPEYGNSLGARADSEAGDPAGMAHPHAGTVDYEKISTAGPGQTTIPRDLSEQVLWNQVRSNPYAGEVLKDMNSDPRFPESDGWQKMRATHYLPDGSAIEIHYQYNASTNKSYDIKITTPQRIPPVLQP